MANVFKLAKAYQRKHPKTDWQTCIQKVSGKKSRVGATKKKAAKKKSASRQTGTSNAAYDKRVKARAPGARVPAGGKKVTYYERRKNRSDAPGSLTGVSESRLTAVLREKLKERLGKQMVSKELTTGKMKKRRWTKAIAETRTKLKRLS